LPVNLTRRGNGEARSQLLIDPEAEAILILNRERVRLNGK